MICTQSVSDSASERNIGRTAGALSVQARGQQQVLLPVPLDYSLDLNCNGNSEDYTDFLQLQNPQILLIKVSITPLL